MSAREWVTKHRVALAVAFCVVSATKFFAAAWRNVSSFNSAISGVLFAASVWILIMQLRTGPSSHEGYWPNKRSQP